MDKLPVDDFMSLTALNVPELPDNLIFPQEVNEYLRKEIRALTSENGRLQRALEEKEDELKESVQQNEQLSVNWSPLFGLGKASELAANKIVELSKRVRELTGECEGLKTRLRAAEKKLVAPEEGHGDAKEIVPPEHDPEKEVDQIKALTEKLSSTMGKLCDSRNQCQQLKQELKLMNKALTSEVGDNVSLQTIVSGNSSWRGRAQQILSLQQKVSDLQNKLREQSGEEKQTVESSAAAAVRQLERDRRAMNEQSVRQLKVANEQLDETRRKLEASRTRCRILEGDVSTHKKRIEKLLESSVHDNQLIQAMTAEMEVLEAKLSEREQNVRRNDSHLEEKCKCLNEIVAKERAKNDQLHDLLAEKDDKIQRLESLETMYSTDPTSDNCPTQSLRTADGRSVYGRSASADETGEHHIMLLAAAAERQRLTELLAVLNRRLDSQRAEAEATQANLRKERARCARLETKVGRLELCGPGGRNNSYQGLRMAREVPEEVQNKMELLREEVLALKTRLRCVEQEKEHDLKVFNFTAEETRRLFSDAIKSNAGSQIGISSSNISCCRSLNL